MLPILCSGIAKTNIGLKVLNYLPLMSADFPPQALFARRLMLRVTLLRDKHFFVSIFYNTFLYRGSYIKLVNMATFARFANGQRWLCCF